MYHICSVITIIIVLVNEIQGLCRGLYQTDSVGPWAGVKVPVAPLDICESS